MTCHAEDFGITDTSELSGVQSCDCREAVELPFEMWNLCANGGGEDICECTGTVRYGTEDDYFQREVIGSVNCRPDNFRTGQGYDIIEVGDSSNNRGTNTRDPVSGVFKSCFCLMRQEASAKPFCSVHREVWLRHVRERRQRVLPSQPQRQARG